MQNAMRPPADADTAWWVRWAARGLGVIGGVCTFTSAIYIISCCFPVSMALGILAMVTLNTTCLAAGLIQMFVCLCIIIPHPILIIALLDFSLLLWKPRFAVCGWILLNELPSFPKVDRCG
jgi:hypothetical protein